MSAAEQAVSFATLGRADARPDPRAARWTTIDVASLPGHEADDDGDDPVWVLPGLLERGSRLLLAGDEGIGKSLLLKQWMVHLAAGLPPLPGQPGCDPLRCVVVDTELNIRTARRRLRPMADHADLAAGHLLYVLAPAGVDLLNEDDHTALVRVLQQFKPDVIAIDSLYRAFNGDPDDPRIGGQVQRVLDTMRTHTGAAIILACHYRKRASDGRQRRTLDDLAGSRVWKAWPETAVDITRDKLRVLKDREGLAGEVALTRREAGEWETEPDGWPFTFTAGDTGSNTWQGHTIVQGYALEVLARADAPISTSRVTDLIAEDRAVEGRTKFHRSNVAAALGELHDKQHVTKTPGARGANDWTITPDGLQAITARTKEPA